MARINQTECFHSQFTGYADHCVCIDCGFNINYEDINLEKNDASLKNYIKTVLDQVDPDLNGNEVKFEIGVSSQGLVEQGSTNRISFVKHNI